MEVKIIFHGSGLKHQIVWKIASGRNISRPGQVTIYGTVGRLLYGRS